MTPETSRRILVRGSGDIGSAVAHRLFLAGYAVIIHDGCRPAMSRRGMAFTDAIFDGQAVLEGVTAMRVDDVATLDVVLTEHKPLPVAVADFPDLLAAVRHDILIDARMRKRVVPEVQRGLAPLTIRLGPNFIAGETTDLAVETSWGDELGAVVACGSPRPLAGEPRPLAGHGRDRFVYAPVAGIFRTTYRIGDLVRAEDVVAHIDVAALHAPLDGILRGLTHDGVPVLEGVKVIEVDPRGSAAVVTGIGGVPPASSRAARLDAEGRAPWYHPPGSRDAPCVYSPHMLERSAGGGHTHHGHGIRTSDVCRHRAQQPC